MSGEKLFINVATPEFVLYYPHLAERSAMSGKFEINMVFEDDQDLGQLEAAIEKAGKSFFGSKTFKSPIRNGDEKESMPDGKRFVCSKTKNAVRLVDAKKQALEPEDFYGGAICKAVVCVSPYTTNANGRGVSAYLVAVQKVRDGERLGGNFDDDALDMLGDIDIEDDFG